ncbi:cytochrome-c oxidase, cbb3-type subunit III [Sinisalibacter aestuarii]|uniref:Cbb3-type cytochrome c oxidase subunit n=1 Tax=Sinisalibacter aestuarii TaxID=2949426 RepID=A0ABQ5LMC7_9RHOB|nr:cytochrome-c oxidase, cbb3-type subunit III [Sinisalibacter aestuarii]GKY86175.1 Cbb3-type cytochrome c oxidase subunit CcoP [Sinisalibacter aestuarii]
MSKDDHNKVNTTGHEWDGIEEYNNPLPRWWVWIFYATIIWGIGYSIAYPAWPLVKSATPGLLGFSTRANVAADIETFEAMNGEVEAQLASADLTTLADNPDVYNYAIQSGRATFATYCSQCHGSGAAGAVGYPNLLDNDWLWGGDIEEIAFTIRHGVRNTEDEDNARFSEMPAFGDDYLTDDEITNVVAYVRSLAGLENEHGDVAEGAVVFEDNCASCHMEDGTGDRAQGAPNLTDAIWLFGSSPEQVEQSVRVGPYGVMPAWGMNENFDDAKINAVAAYVHQLGGGE